MPLARRSAVSLRRAVVCFLRAQPDCPSETDCRAAQCSSRNNRSPDPSASAAFARTRRYSSLAGALNSTCRFIVRPLRSSSSRTRASRRRCESRRRRLPTSRRQSAASQRASRHRTTKSNPRRATPAATTSARQRSAVTAPRSNNQQNNDLLVAEYAIRKSFEHGDHREQLRNLSTFSHFLCFSCSCLCLCG